MNEYDPIFEYNLDEMETKAYKLSLIWYEKSRKIFPDYKHTIMKKGDPRKSLAFKYCFKLARETNGILLDEEYHLYIRAQLDVLANLVKHNRQILIDPGCLVGDKAWIRWKLWKKKYDSISSKPQEVSKVTHPGISKALYGLETTKEFLTKSLGADRTIEKYREAKINNNLSRWINLGKISPYYLAISPFISSIFTELEMKKFNFDLAVYRESITEEVYQRFSLLFPEEKLPTT